MQAAARPEGLNIVVFFTFFQALIATLGAIWVLVGNPGGYEFTWVLGLSRVVAFVGCIAVAALFVLLADGFSKLQPWAWKLGVVLQIVSLVLSPQSFLIPVLLLLYLLRPDVRRAFGQ